jgi:RHS repeat-associated core domain
VSKTGVGTLYYDGQKPHAVSAADNTSGYIPSTTQQVTYTPFGKVATLTDGDYSMTFTYGPDQQRWMTVLKKNGTVKRKVFYAGDYERVTENGTTRHFYYLDNGCIYVINDSLNTGHYYYTFTDHLGSVTRIYDEYGFSTVYIAEYDAWGKQTVTKNTIHFQRGYTGHEMLPEFGLINMNGRLYDLVLGRFLSPDNYVQMPNFSQSFNRYSYCINNPLKYNDPNGELFGIDDLLIIAGALVGGYLGGVAMNQGELNPLSWDYSEPFTYIGIAFGGLTGGIAGSTIAGSTAFGFTFTAGNAYLAAGVTVGATAGSGMKYGFHWTTAGGGGGSISNTDSPEKNVNKAIDKVRKEYFENQQWFNDFNNMIGDISYGIYKFGPSIYKEYARSINNVSSGINIALNYGEFTQKVLNDTYNDEDIQEFYVNSMGDAGAYMGAYIGGYLLTNAFAGAGPAAAVAGIWGAVMGANIGRQAFGYMGELNYEIFIVSKRIRQLDNLQKYNQIHYPILYP